ncbi:MAG TPA: response regulator, partial [Cytophagales bacterium]|nr:response regulator [Cytophagales bacterium]
MRKVKNLQNILLIDDDAATNYFNQMVISLLDIEVKVDIALNGFEALNYITEQDLKQDKSGIILLDLNMPNLNGWEFLEQYSAFSHKVKSRYKIFILSTNNNNDDQTYALNHLDVSGYIVKPLS